MSCLNTNNKKHLVSVAPMMDCTDKHDRYFLRLIAPNILLYTEMITAYALTYGDAAHLLNFHPKEKPLVLQLGGSDPKILSQCAKLGEDYGYDEINLNVGCPSDRVQSGQFGACLMLKPMLVADCVFAMQSKLTIPVTVKCRIGVDDNDSYEFLHKFIEIVSAAGCKVFIVHARKALLTGFSPKQNRTIPPLRYEIVKRLKQSFPELTIILNGGINSLSDIKYHLADMDGVMLGRTAYATPYLLADIEAHYFNNEKILSRHQVIEHLIPYINDQLSKGVRLANITRHIFGLFHGQPGAAAWRRFLSEQTYKSGAGVELLTHALRLVSP